MKQPDILKTRGAFLALLALQSGPMHGYQIASWLQERTHGFFTLSWGALYPILHRLERQGFIAGAWEDIGPAKKRKIYSISAKGRRAAGEERERYEAFLDAFAKLLGDRA